MTPRRILVVDDDERQASDLCGYIRDYIASAPNLFPDQIETTYGTDAVAIANELRISRGVGFGYHLIVADVFMPPAPGLDASPSHGGVLIYETLSELKAGTGTQDLDVKLVLITNRGDDADRVLAKPRREQHALRASHRQWMFTLAKTERAPGPGGSELMKHAPWVREIGRIIASLSEDDWMAWRLGGALGELLSVVPRLDEVKRAIDEWKEIYLVTVEGERGVGVDIVARALHEASSRAVLGHAFLGHRCNVEGESLERLLFGGGTGDGGWLAGAAAGTVFLDGFGDQALAHPSTFRDLFDPSIREYRSVGGGDARKFEGAIVIGTLDASRLCDLVAGDGSFADFIQPHVIRIPPLRDRPRDIRFLAEHYWAQAQATHNRKLDPLPEPVLDALMGHLWAGNQIELQRVISTMVRDASSAAVSVDLLPVYIRGASGTGPYSHRRLESALRVTQGNRAQADRFLGATPLDEKFARGSEAIQRLLSDRPAAIQPVTSRRPLVLRLNEDERLVWVCDVPVPLQHLSYEVLAALAKSPTRWKSDQSLTQECGDHNYRRVINKIKNAVLTALNARERDIATLRETIIIPSGVPRLELDTAKNVVWALIVNRPGLGYRISLPPNDIDIS